MPDLRAVSGPDDPPKWQRVRPFERQPDESEEEWQVRVERDWPSTAETVKLIESINENQRRRKLEGG